MKKSFFGLSSTLLTVCVGLTVIIGLLSFWRTGTLNIAGMFVLFMLFVVAIKGVWALRAALSDRKKK